MMRRARGFEFVRADPSFLVPFCPLRRMVGFSMITIARSVILTQVVQTKCSASEVRQARVTVATYVATASTET
jgi:hypothetical protein